MTRPVEGGGCVCDAGHAWIASEMGMEGCGAGSHGLGEWVAAWTCFTKDDSEEDCVGCFAICRDDFRQLFVEMKDEAQSSGKATPSNRHVP